MKNKGFTLIELLGVIIILALLMILVFPSIINSVKNTSNKTDDLTKKLIYNAADLFIDEHKSVYPKVSGNKYRIGVWELVSEGLLSSPIKLSDSDEDVTNTKCVDVTYTTDYEYELIDCKSTIILPSEYQQVEYIESTGTQYIDTGYINTDDYKPYKVEVMFQYTDITKKGFVFGTVQDTSNFNPLTFGIDISNNAWLFGHYGTSGTSIRFGVIDTNKHKIEYVFKEGIYLDNVLVDSTVEQASTSSNSSKKIALFGRIKDNTIELIPYLKMYYCKFYEENGVLVRNFIPCYRKSDNVIGMYDTVNDVFYTNAGTGTFKKGNDL